MRLAILVIALFLGADNRPMVWLKLQGSNPDKIEYRWSNPARNSCLIEFRSRTASKPKPLPVKATLIDNVAISVTPESISALKPQATVVKEHKAARTIVVRILGFGPDTHSFEDCYRIVDIVASPAGPENQTNFTPGPWPQAFVR